MKSWRTKNIAQEEAELVISRWRRIGRCKRGLGSKVSRGRGEKRYKGKKAQRRRGTEVQSLGMKNWVDGIMVLSIIKSF